MVAPAAFEAARRRLEAQGAAPVVVDDLCRLVAQRDGLVRQVAASPSPVILACHARAIRWLFEAAAAPLPDDASILDLRTGPTDEVVARLPALAGPPQASPAAASDMAGPRPQAETLDPAWPPWFPVIDYSRCVSCGQCVNFCLFGVYQAGSDRRVTVVKPASCKNECPACARVCPKLAIIFPKYAEGPISGEPVGPQDEAQRPNFAGMSRDSILMALRQRGRKLLRPKTPGGGHE